MEVFSRNLLAILSRTRMLYSSWSIQQGFPTREFVKSTTRLLNYQLKDIYFQAELRLLEFKRLIPTNQNRNQMELQRFVNGEIFMSHHS